MKKSVIQVQGTNDYNTESKCSMVHRGYFKDDFISIFVRKFSRRTPLINIGYYMRVLTVDFALKSFLKAMEGQQAQIISCGAGFDTSYFRFAASGILGPKHVFYEIDFDEVVKSKSQSISTSDTLLHLIGKLTEVPEGFVGLLTAQYRLFAADLSSLEDLESKLKLFGIQFSAPTLLLAECSICYMEEESSSRLIEWAALKFADATFVTYEQVYPNDGFGVVMNHHFAAMNSPLLSLRKFPDLQSQEHRYRSRDWSSCHAWTAFEIFLQVTNNVEQHHIITLEPFDEFEEWYLEGSHFTLIIASRGRLVDWHLKYLELPPIRVNEGRPQVDLEIVPGSCNIHRYAHKSAALEKHILIVGGFGPSASSKHGRREEPVVINVSSVENNNPKLRIKDFTFPLMQSSKYVALDLMHHTCTPLSASNKVLVFGGRQSPARVNITWPPIVLTSSKNAMPEVTVPPVQGDITPPPRWRHTAVNFPDIPAGQDNILIYGGRNSHAQVLGDLFILEVSTEISCREIRANTTPAKWPEARFSHSAVACGEHTMYVSGGLGSNLIPLSDVWSFDLTSETWTEIPVIGALPRFSHTSAVCQKSRILLLIGGVNSLPGQQPGICSLNLDTYSCTEYRLPLQEPSRPIMLHNHSSEVLEDKKSLLIIGGGGNCFSFGTMFNEHFMILPMEQFQCAS